MKKPIIELISTIIIGTWVIYNLCMYLPNTINAGWHTSSQSKEYLFVKIAFLTLTVTFFLYRSITLYKEIWSKKAK